MGLELARCKICNKAKPERGGEGRGRAERMGGLHSASCSPCTPSFRPYSNGFRLFVLLLFHSFLFAAMHVATFLLFLPVPDT